MFVFVLFEADTESKVYVRERHFHWWGRDREVAREPESRCRALLPCPMAHARRHACAVSRACASAARTAKSFRALSMPRASSGSFRPLHPRTLVLVFAVTLFCVGSALDKTNRGFLTTTRSQPRLGLVEGSRGPTQIHIRDLCHWAGEPAGHLGAESPSRRTAGPASTRKTSPPCPH